MLTFMFTPTTIPFFHRFGRITQRRSLVFLVFLTGLMMAIFSARSAYDAEHPKRLGVQYVHNVRLGVVPYDLLKTLALTSSRLWHADQVTSGENHLHMAQMDRGPGFQDILQRLHDRYGLPHHPLTPNPRSDDNSDWDVLYPISAFLETEMFELGVSELNPGRTLPEMQIDLVHDEWHEEDGVRSIALRVQHVSGSSCAKSRMRVCSGSRFCPRQTGLVYPVIAFSGEVLSWTFEVPPPSGRQRHYIKAAAPPSRDEYSVELRLKMDENSLVGFNWVGIGERWRAQLGGRSLVGARRLITKPPVGKQTPTNYSRLLLNV
jgi:hypothetical protein